jgi:hypothetical protein
MVGFIFGTVCLIGIARVLRHRHWSAPFGGGAFGCGRYRDGFDAQDSPWPRRSRGRQWFLRALLERLGTTPGQEKAIVSALDELDGNRAAIRDEMRRTRVDVADVLSGGLVDDAGLEETFARHDRLLARLRVSVVEAMKKVADALDERQRTELAQMLQGGRRFGGSRWGGPFDSVWA